MTTLLEIVNSVLLSIGERQVGSLSSPVSLKAANAVRDSIQEFCLLDDFSFLRQKVTSGSWVNDRATVECIRVVDVYYGARDTGYTKLPFVFEDEYLKRGVQPGSPTMWSIENHNTVLVNPYPTTPEEQLKVTFSVTKMPTLPVLADDTIDELPDLAKLAVTKRACYNMSLRHLDDAGLAAQFNNEFEVLVQQMRNVNRGSQRGAANLYRRR